MVCYNTLLTAHPAAKQQSNDLFFDILAAILLESLETRDLSW